MGFIRSLDPKLVSTLLATGLARAVLALGGDPVGDPLYNGLIALAVGAVVGWLWPNAGTVLRTPQEDGNPDLTKSQAGYGIIELLFALILLVLLIWVIAALLPSA
jgi:hypothetical protein